MRELFLERQPSLERQIQIRRCPCKLLLVLLLRPVASVLATVDAINERSLGESITGSLKSHQQHRRKLKLQLSDAKANHRTA
mgnify:CR=1 FL=1